jgi:transposase
MTRGPQKRAAAIAILDPRRMRFKHEAAPIRIDEGTALTPFDHIPGIVAASSIVRAPRAIKIPVDAPGLMLNVVVHLADVQDRDGAFTLLHQARRLFPFIKRIFADGGYRGERMAPVIPHTGAWKLEIVKRSNATGFEALHKRWIVDPNHSIPFETAS